MVIFDNIVTMIDPEIDERLESIEKIVNENNTMLHKMRRAQIWANFMRFIYWAVLIVMSGAIYLWLEPYLKTLMGMYANMSSLFN